MSDRVATTHGLALEQLSMRFGGREVLTDASLRIVPGRVHALVGKNGAGKSTLIRIACGMLRADRGTVRVDGHRLAPGSARDASERGVGVVHQHFMLVDTLTVAENVVLGSEPRRTFWRGAFDRPAAHTRVLQLAREHGLSVDPAARVESLSVGERQRVELLKVLHRGARFVLLDEPTAVLSPGEIRALLDVIRALARAGAGVLFVSHKLDEVLDVADDVTVLRRGRVVLERPRSEVDGAEIARAVVGGEVPHADETRGAAISAAGDALVLEKVRAAGLHDVSLRVASGEVLGIAGVEGNGQRALAQAVMGLIEITDGSVRLGARELTTLSVAQRRAAGLGFVPEDREGSGLMADLTVAENLALGDARTATTRRGVLPPDLEARAREWIERFGVRPADPRVRVAELSGGNAQKVLIARELSRRLGALVVAQPTRGIDLGAAVDVHQALRRARDEGTAVLLIASDLDEIRALSDRVVVMRRGAIVGELPVAEASDARLGPMMVGATSPSSAVSS